MAFTHTIGQSVTASGTVTTKSTTYTGGIEQNLSESVPDASTDLAISFTLDVSACQSFFMVSDQALTVETNSATTATNTISLLAEVPYVWNSDSYDTFKLTGDVTSLFITNASGDDATLDIRSISDPTPA